MENWQYELQRIKDIGFKDSVKGLKPWHFYYYYANTQKQTATNYSTRN